MGECGEIWRLHPLLSPIMGWVSGAPGGAELPRALRPVTLGRYRHQFHIAFSSVLVELFNSTRGKMGVGSYSGRDGSRARLRVPCDLSGNAWAPTSFYLRLFACPVFASEPNDCVWLKRCVLRPSACALIESLLRKVHSRAFAIHPYCHRIVAW